jgi:hypothetical protein
MSEGKSIQVGRANESPLGFILRSLLVIDLVADDLGAPVVRRRVPAKGQLGRG